MSVDPRHGSWEVKLHVCICLYQHGSSKWLRGEDTDCIYCCCCFIYVYKSARNSIVFFLCRLNIKHTMDFQVVRFFLNWAWSIPVVIVVPDMEMGCCLGSEGNWVSVGEGGERGPGPPDSGKDKQSVPNEGRDNIGKDKEDQPSRMWWRRIGANRVSSHLIKLKFCKYEHWGLILIIVLSSENKSYGVKNHLQWFSVYRCWTSHQEQ